MDTVLLINGRSFIGGHVCRALVKRGYKVLLHSTTTPKFENLKDILPHPQITPVVCPYDQHEQLLGLMAQAQSVIFSAVPPSKQSLGQSKAKERDLQNFKYFMDALAASSIQKSVFISTCSTIGKVKDGLADETCIAQGPQGWQGIAFKFRLEDMVMDYFRKGMKVVIVNPTMFIGEYDTKPSTGEFFRFIDKAPFVFLKGTKINILDMEDAGRGTVLALEKGRIGERYLLGGKNILNEDLIARIKKCGGQRMPVIAVPYAVSVVLAYISELVNLILRQDKPLIPLIGIELTAHGTQHFSCAKAERELGFVPGETWPAVDRAYQWYKDHGVLA